MKLFEILDKKFTELEVNEDNEDQYSVTSKIGNREINFDAQRWTNDEYNYWEVDFSEVVKMSSDPKARKGHTYALTKSGNEFEVFAFIKQCMEQFIQKHKPNMIKFTADKEGSVNRASVYERLLKKFLKGYSIKINDDGSRQVKFTLEKL
jgi:hypothetical protein